MITDNGSQYVSADFRAYLRERDISHSRARVRHPQSNGKMERFHKSLKRECVRVEPMNDLAEARSIRQAFGDATDNLCVSATKSILGHMIHAAGAVELAITALALRDGFAPPTLNLTGFTVIYSGPTFMVEQGFDRKNPYVSGIVELEEGASISARITGLDVSKPEEIKVGTPLTVDFLEFGEGDAKKTYLAFKA